MAREIAIVGGGVIGLATAWALVQRGHAVRLIERHGAVGLETSRANGGQLSYRYVSPLADAGVVTKAMSWLLQGDSAPVRWHATLESQDWRWYAAFLRACNRQANLSTTARLLRLSLHSRDILEAWRPQLDAELLQWRRSGKLVVYRDRGGLEDAARKIAPSPEAEAVLDTAACLSLEPALAALGPVLAGGIYSESDECADAYGFCLALERLLLASGRYERVAVEAHGFALAGGRLVALDLGNGRRLHAEQFVIAAGNGSRPLMRCLGRDLPIQSLYGYRLTLPIRQRTAVPEVSVTDFANKVVYARLGDRLRAAAMVDLGRPSEAARQRRLAALRQLVAAAFPGAGDVAEAESWVGARPATPSGLPIIGATPWRNLWLNAGHGSLGFTLACGSAALLSDLIDGRKPSVPAEDFAAPFAPN